MLLGVVHKWSAGQNAWERQLSTVVEVSVELVGTCEDRFIAVDFDLATFLSSSFLLLFPLRHRVGAAYQAGILSAASRAEIDN